MSHESEISAAIKDVTAGVEDFKKKQADANAELKALAEAGEKVSAEALKKADEAAEQVAASAAALAEIEQQVAAYVAKNGSAPADQSLGGLIVNSDDYKAFIGGMMDDRPANGQTFRTQVQANTITGQDGGSPAENSDVLVPADRRAGIVPGAFRKLRVLDMLTTIPTQSNAVEFTKENAWTNNAAETNEGEVKSESDLTFTQDNANVRTIAHTIKLSVQILSDAPALRAYVNRRMVHGVNQRLDTQLVAGDGTSPNLDGMLNTGNFTAFAPTASETAIDGLNRAKEALELADYAATGILMNPADWYAIERLKTADLTYLVGDPFGQIIPRLWGLPIVTSKAITAGSFLMADFEIAYEHYSRSGIAVEFGYVNDDFARNLITMRAERRDALATLNAVAARSGLLVAA